MEAIATAAGVRIDQWGPQVVFAQEPAECAGGPCRPLHAPVRPPRGEAGGNRRGRLDRLLVECFGRLANPAEAPGADWSEASRCGGLQRHEPTERPQTDLDVPWRLGRQA